MNDNAKLWVEELKTTDLPQGNGRMQSEQGYCCLAIGCLVYERETGNKLLRNEETGHLDGYLLSEYSPVLNWLGLKSSVGKFKKGLNGSLAVLNDRFRLSFHSIGVSIEYLQDELFVKDET